MFSLVISLCCRFDSTALYKGASIINSFVVCEQMCAVILERFTKHVTKTLQADQQVRQKWYSLQ